MHTVTAACHARATASLRIDGYVPLESEDEMRST